MEEKSTALDKILFAVFIVLFIGINIWAFSKEGGHTLNKDGVGMLFASFLTLALYSFLYKDNPLFKFAEHFYVGIGMGYVLVITYFDIIKKEAFYPLVARFFQDNLYHAPDYGLLIPIGIGMLMFSRFTHNFTWLSRYAFAFIVGYGAGTTIPNFIQGNLIKQLDSTLFELSFSASGFTFAPIIAGILIAAILYYSRRELQLSLAVLGFFFASAFTTTAVFNELLSFVGVYFYFSMEHKGAVGGISKVGVWFLMLSFGASFGYTVMGRMALLNGRVGFLINEWLKLGAPQ